MLKNKKLIKNIRYDKQIWFRAKRSEYFVICSFKGIKVAFLKKIVGFDSRSFYKNSRKISL